MKSLSVSMSKGNVALDHNRRANIPNNATPEKIKDNIYIKTCKQEEELPKVFNEIFADSVADYNAKQKRADRKKKDYYKEIDSDKSRKNAEKPVYEYVFQYGSMYDNNVNFPEFAENVEVTTKMLVEFAKRFEEKYKNLRVISAVIHRDEQTPHLHLDLVPTATGYKNGMEMRCSLTKALNNLGFKNTAELNETTGKNQRTLALTHWQNDVKKLMVEVMEEYGYTREYKNNTEKHLSIDKYEQATENAKLLAVAENAKREAEQARREKAEIEESIKELQAESDESKKEKAKIEAENDKIKKEKAEIEATVKTLSDNLTALQAESDEIKSEHDKIKDEVVTLTEKNRQTSAELSENLKELSKIINLFPLPEPPKPPFSRKPEPITFSAKEYIENRKPYDFDGLPFKTRQELKKDYKKEYDEKVKKAKAYEEFEKELEAYRQQYTFIEAVREYEQHLKEKEKQIDDENWRKAEKLCRNNYIDKITNLRKKVKELQTQVSDNDTQLAESKALNRLFSEYIAEINNISVSDTEQLVKDYNSRKAEMDEDEFEELEPEMDEEMSDEELEYLMLQQGL